MRMLIVTIMAFVLYGFMTARAQALILDQPACFKVINKDTQRIYGHVETDWEPKEQIRHRRNFKLDPGNEVEICTTGPLYPGYRVEFVIKGLFPLFSCYTSVYKHIIIERILMEKDSYKKDARGQTIWAECY